MSLRTKLVLLLSGLAVLVVAIVVGAAYEEVKRSTMLAASERLGRAVEQLGDLAAAGTGERLRLKESLGSDPLVRAAARGEPVDTAGLLERLGTLRSPADSGLAIQVWDAAGEPVFSDVQDRIGLPASEAPLDTLPTYGFFRPWEDEIRYWSTAVIRSEAGERIGWVMQERRIGNAQTAAQLQELIGPDARVVFAALDDTLAVTLAGEGVRSPLSGLPTDTLLTYERGGRLLYARADSVPDSPWAVLVETPADAVQARVSAFLERMLVIASLLVLVTLIAGSLLGRRLTGPLTELVAASEELAQGGAVREIPADGDGDELSRLTGAFNEMARRVAATHGELERRLDAQTTLARALEDSTTRAEHARREAQEANRAKSDFLATMSHEIRTPINAILGYCDLLELQMSGPLTDKQKEKVERIRRSSRVLGALVEDVLDFAGLDSGRLRVECVDAPLRDAVLGAAAVIEPQAVEAGLALEVDVPPDLRFRGDPRRVEQIVSNLLSNAVKFTEEGTISVRASAHESREPGDAAPEDGDGGAETDRPEPPPTPEHGWVRLDVRDPGVGISKEYLDRIFEPFVQEQTGFTRRYGGTGLGLSISLELARMMGGDLTVESQPGDGSCFSLWIPAAPAA